MEELYLILLGFLIGGFFATLLMQDRWINYCFKMGYWKERKLKKIKGAKE